MQRLAWDAILGHAARLGVSAGALAFASHRASVIGAVAGAGMLFFELFAATHDVAHGALGLSRRSNEVALGVLGALSFQSGHAMRRMHLDHHRFELGERDVEGIPARLPLAQAILFAPLHAVSLRVEAFRRSEKHGRRIQALEMAAVLALLLFSLATGSMALVVYALVCCLLHASAGVWAAHVPHNLSPKFARFAARFAFTRSPTALALAFHERHHEMPRVPCQRLAGAAALRDRAARFG